MCVLMCRSTDSWGEDMNDVCDCGMKGEGYVKKLCVGKTCEEKEWMRIE